MGTEQVVYERPAAKWDYRFDTRTGRAFFVDHVNQTTSWVPPVGHEGAAYEPVMPSTVATAAPNAHANPSVSRPAPSSVTAASVPPATVVSVVAASSAVLSLPAGWRQLADPRGVPYFVGPSGQPQWEPPIASEQPIAPPLPKGWIEKCRGGRRIYINQASNYISFERPVGPLGNE